MGDAVSDLTDPVIEPQTSRGDSDGNHFANSWFFEQSEVLHAKKTGQKSYFIVKEKALVCVILHFISDLVCNVKRTLVTSNYLYYLPDPRTQHIPERVSVVLSVFSFSLVREWFSSLDPSKR